MTVCTQFLSKSDLATGLQDGLEERVDHREKKDNKKKRTNKKLLEKSSKSYYMENGREQVNGTAQRYKQIIRNQEASAMRVKDKMNE